MIIYPAIDLKDGHVVQLRQGNPDKKKIYSSDPLEIARRWKDSGAEWLHIVNLDGALDSDAKIWSIVEGIARIGLPIQLGGGLRTIEDITQAIEYGVKRAVVGTAAVENPSMMNELIEKHGAAAIVVALDARGGKVATHGWKTLSEWSAADLGRDMMNRGVRHALYTDIQRDGELQGVNIEATPQLSP